jgi:hypothetical protein
MNLTNSQSLFAQMSEEDFTAVIDTAMRECGVKTKARANELLRGFLQWFSLIPNHKEHNLQMVRSVDRIWHAMVLNTKFYREFCHKYFGKPIDHNPMDVMGNPKEAKAVYAGYTVKMLKAEFGNKVNVDLLNVEQELTCCIGCG